MSKPKARYIYACAVGGESVTKTAVGTSSGKKIVAGLHGWRCDTHGSVKVIRTLKGKE